MIRGLEWAARLLRRRSAAAGETTQAAALRLALDGETATALLALELGDAAGLKSGDSRATATRVWRRSGGRADTSRTRSLGVEETGPRGALAAAMGLSLTGMRASAFVSSDDLTSSAALLRAMSGRPLPLVVHLSARSLSAHANARGSGHEVLAHLRDAGWVVLVARNVQSAVDLALVARRVTERALVPAVVVMDHDQVATSLQDVVFPAREDLDRFVGSAADEIPSPTPAQELVYGETRRRIPRGVDLDRPVLHGGTQGPESWAAGAEARSLFGLAHVKECVEEAFTAFENVFGRSADAVVVEGKARAKVAVVAQGSAVEQAMAVARAVQISDKLGVRVVGVQSLRPLPERQLVDALVGASAVLVLERTPRRLEAEPPLMGELRALFDRCQENQRSKRGRSDEAPFTHLPSLTAARLPRLVSVRFGEGGAPLPASDLADLCRTVETLESTEYVLGWPKSNGSSLLPKQRALRDAVQRRYPGMANFGFGSGLDTTHGLSTRPPKTGDVPDETLRVVVHRLHRQGGGGLAPLAADLLLEVRGGVLRSRLAERDGAWGTACMDRFEVGVSKVYDTDEPEPAHLGFVGWNGAPSARAAAEGLAFKVPIPEALDPWRGLQRGAVLVVCADGDDGTIRDALTPRIREGLRSRGIALHVVPRGEAAGAAEARLLGAGIAAIEAQMRGISVKKAKVAFRNRAKELAVEDGWSEAEAEAWWTEFERGIEEARVVSFEEDVAGADSVPVAIGSDDPSFDPRTTASGVKETVPPFAVRRMTRTDQRIDSLPRFWDQVGILYAEGAPAALRPDPYLANGAVPPLSACFRDISGAHATIPKFLPAACTGCADCWPVCPDGALAPVVLGFAQILESGMARAKAAGGDPTALRPVVSKLAAAANEIVEAAESPPASAGEVLEDAMPRVLEAMSAPESRRATLVEAFAPVLESVRDFAIARTQPFFGDLEAASKGTGQLLSIAIDPGSCKGCQSCVRACSHGALVAELQTPEVRGDRERRWELWQTVPDTSGETIRRAAGHADVGPLAADLLSRHALLAMSGGDGAEAGSGEKLALRLVLGIAESTLQPALVDQLAEIEALRKQIEAAIKETMAQSIPDVDLDVLSRSLEKAGGARAELSALTDRLREESKSRGLDAGRLQDLVAMAETLGELSAQLREGPNGFGRSRYSLAFGDGSIAEWATEFPLNPFQVPVVVDATGEVCAMAHGMMEGQLAQAMDGVRAMRRAKLLLESPPDLVSKLSAVDRLGWRDIPPEERRFCPPVLVVVDERTVGETLGNLTPLLETDLPIRILVLSGVGGDFGRDLGGRRRSGPSLGSYVGPGVLALTNRRAFVHQSSIAYPDHLHRGVVEALRSPRPALIHVFAPSPQRHGFDADGSREQSLRAVQSRVVPLFIYDPEKEGVFGSRLDLAANPALEETCWKDEQGCPMTPVDWALGQERFARHFRPVSADAPSPTPLLDYLGLTPREREGRTPFRTVRGCAVDSARQRELESSGVERMEISAEMVEFTEHHLGVWTTLQELAGVRTPFTERVEAEARERIEAEFQQKEAALKREHDDRVAGLRGEIEEEFTQRVSSRLYDLAQRGLPENGQ